VKRNIFTWIVGGMFAIFTVAINFVNNNLQNQISEQKISHSQFQLEIRNDIKEIRKEISTIATNVGKISTKFENSIIE